MRIDRQVDKTSPVWQTIYRVTDPNGGALSSFEPFTHNGKSYVFVSVAVPPNDFPSAVYLSTIDSRQPMFRKLTPDLPLRSRKDGEVFVTNAGPSIYFNRADPTLVAPGQPPDNCIQCSEGVFRTDSGLGPVTAP